MNNNNDILELVKEALLIMLIGFESELVLEKCEKMGLDARVSKEDGKYMMLTADFNPKRLNLEVENGIVVKVTTG